MPTYGSFKYGEGKYGAAWQLPFSAVVGSYRGHRFTMFMAQDGQTQIHDKLVDSDTTVYLRYLTNGLILKFDPAKDHILIYSPLIDDLQASDNSNFFVASLDTSADFLQLRGADFLDGRELKWDMGMIPFDVSLLLTTGLPADWDSYTAPWYEQWPGLGNTVIAGGTAVSKSKALPGGSYRAYILWAGVAASDSCAIFSAVVDGGETYDTGTIDPIDSLGQWNYLDFIVPAGGADVHFEVDDQDCYFNDTIIGEIVAFPISNSKNFPLNVRNQALRLTKQKLRGAEK